MDFGGDEMTGHDLFITVMQVAQGFCLAGIYVNTRFDKCGKRKAAGR